MQKVSVSKVRTHWKTVMENASNEGAVEVYAGSFMDPHGGDRTVQCYIVSPAEYAKLTKTPTKPDFRQVQVPDYTQTLHTHVEAPEKKIIMKPRSLGMTTSLNGAVLPEKNPVVAAPVVEPVWYLGQKGVVELLDLFPRKPCRQCSLPCDRALQRSGKNEYIHAGECETEANLM